jgi:hypothetical protein
LIKFTVTIEAFKAIRRTLPLGSGMETSRWRKQALVPRCAFAIKVLQNRKRPRRLA